MHCWTNWNTKMRTKILKLYGVLLSVGFVYWLWIRLTGLAIPCLYVATTGLLCPGCGSTRMLLALLRLDFGAAFRYNPVVFVLFWIWNLIALLCLTEKVQFVQRPKFLYHVLALSITALLLFGFLRNIA